MSSVVRRARRRQNLDGGFGLAFPIVQYDFLTTYSDLSSIHGHLAEGQLCANFEDVSQTRS